MDNIDEAWTFLESHGATTDVADAEELRAIRRKADWTILPLLFGCYTLQFIDKALLNYAAVMGIKEDLNLKGNDFSNAATAFWIAFLVAQPPNTYFLQKVPAATWFGGNMVVWGLITAAIAAVRNYAGLLVARIFLGITEATIIPSLLLISSQWYTKSEQALRFAGWSTGIGAGQILGPVVAFGFQHAEDSTLKTWQLMFLTVGLISVIVGIVNLALLPNTPMDAWFLTKSEKIHLLRHVSINKTGIRNRKFQMHQVLETLRDPQVWLFVLIVILQTESSGVVAIYSSTLINNMGFKPEHAALLNAPGGVVTIGFTLLVGIGVRETSHRWAWIVFCSVPGIIGGALMSFLDMSNTAGVLMGIYLVNAIIAPFPIVSNWLAANCAGHTKRALASSLLAMAFSVGNIIGPQTFQARDAPEYRPAKIAVLATQAAAAVVTVVLFLYYRWQNRTRNAAQTPVNIVPLPSGIEDWAGLTDRENSRFRKSLAVYSV
ncbi:hypothetical protein VTO42DRAFT_4968 [Malbranchea cinnamomea]